MKKYLLMMVVLLVALLLIIPTNAQAATVASGTCGEDGDNLSWVLDDQGVLTISGQGRMFDWFDWTRSTAPWSDQHMEIKQVVIEDGVTHIGYQAFSGCTELTQVQIPDSVTSIEAGAFSCTAITTIRLPEITTLEGATFSDCYLLESIVIPDSVEVIASNVFLNCVGLKEITIGKSVTVMGTQAFQNCYALEKVYFNATNLSNMRYGNNTFYNAGIDSNGITLTVGKDVTIIPEYFMCPTASPTDAPNLKTIIFEEGSVCTTIKPSAFAYCNKLTQVTFPDSMQRICGSAFLGCRNLRQITIPDHVDTLEYYAFYGCSNLQQLSLGKNVRYGVTDAFEGCDSLSELYVHADNAYYTAGSQATLYNKDRTVLLKVFYKLSGSYTIPYGVKEIGSRAFFLQSNMTNITIPGTVTKIGNGAFSSCSALEQITIPENVISIDDSAFSCCEQLTAITIPDSVQTLGARVFDMCMNLKTVYIGKGLKSHGEDTFGFTGVQDGIYVDPENAFYCSAAGVLFSKDMKTLYRCPNNKTGQYTIPEGVVTIADSGFYKCNDLTSILFPDSVEHIGIQAFTGCSQVLSFELPQNLKTIGDAAFTGCHAMTRLVIPDGVESISAFLISGCENITTVILGRGVKSLNMMIMSDCPNMETVIFKGNAPAFDSTTFNSVIVTTYYPVNDETWTEETLQQYYGGWVTWKPYSAEKSGSCGEGVAYELSDDGTLVIYKVAETRSLSQGFMTDAPWKLLYSSEIKKVIIEEGVRNVFYGAFDGCSNLESVTVAATVEEVGSNAFANCGQLKSITFEGTAPTMDNSAFTGTSATIYHPANDDSWSEELKQQLGTTFVPVIYGDVNGDGRVNGTDVTMIRRYIAGGYDVELIEEAADVNGDGRINGTDVTLIRRYIAGGYDVTLPYT